MRWGRLWLPGLLLVPGLVLGCRSPRAQRELADQVGKTIVEAKQKDALGRSGPFSIEPPAEALRRRILLSQGLPYASAASLGSDQLAPVPHWPETGLPATPGEAEATASAAEATVLRLGLAEALRIGARNSREYQTQKETVFQRALALDLERDAFRNTFSGLISGAWQTDESGRQRARGVAGSTEVGLSRKLESGATVTSNIAFDLTRLLTGDRQSATGVLADATISIPLLAGAGRHIVTEPLTQADRDVLYALYRLERFRRSYAVRVASEYFDVLQYHDRITNQEQNYRGLVTANRRARRLTESGRMSETDMAEAQQDELSARTAWIQAMQAYAARLDRFKVTLGLPADAKVELNRDELRQLATAAQERLQGVGGTVIAEGPVPPADAPVELVPPGKEGAGPLEMDDAKAVTISLDRRLDLRMLRDQVEDAQRAVVVAADALRPGLNLVTRYETGDRRGALSGAMPDGELRLQHGSYRAGFDLSLPWNKTRARVGYRNSLIALEQAVRDFQDLEDQVKLQVRDSLRRLTLARQSHAIQGRAVELAERRVRSTDLLLQAGRAQIRDLLFAQRDLLRTQNDLTAALISYRVTELEVQRDMDVLEVTDEGLWQEYIPRDEP